ncbi:hypothetical protein ACFQ4N_00090 [Oceanobacillus iheyensis]|uniref:DUF3993 domain-containing protein n=1 Tax=Oceanobacillus iheyensis (strain DSM 14371 / CIP 107618 / JCM 11309 / KCTC 3954 / HTE831) TaxID=221109 RepID=Q8ENZ9_OCEIH|nr:hypothetical protein [Oceanobacillus iheyensis]BAC14276.1 hypothetical protein [Oceanobacillus iheyensis HTE831]
MKNKTYYVLALSIVAFLGIILLSAFNQEEVVNAENHSNSASVQVEKESSILDHSTITEKMNGFMDTLIQEVDSNYKVQAYQSKDELIQAFEQYTTEALASDFVSYYYEEKQDGMYIIPMDAPSWFQEENDYDMIKKDENTIQLTQSNYNEMVGEYTLVVDFTFQHDWKISKITYQ